MSPGRWLRGYAPLLLAAAAMTAACGRGTAPSVPTGDVPNAEEPAVEEPNVEEPAAERAAPLPGPGARVVVKYHIRQVLVEDPDKYSMQFVQIDGQLVFTMPVLPFADLLARN